MDNSLVSTDPSLDNKFYFRPSYTSKVSKDNIEWDTLKRLSSQYERFNGPERTEWQKSKSFLLPIALNTGLLDDLEDDYAKFELIFELTSKVESNCFGICAFTKQVTRAHLTSSSSSAVHCFQSLASLDIAACRIVFSSRSSSLLL
jgi:hypothetical protein